jgi:cytochrome c oxidase assembly protein subunit 15
MSDLYDLSPAFRLMGMGLVLALGPVAWVWLRNKHQPVARRLRLLTLLTLFLTFDLVLFGAFTRLTDSGLGCPDWPGCYGHASPVGAHQPISAAQAAMPTGPVTHSKAWIEMIHRYLATGVGVLILTLTVFTWLEGRAQRRAAPSQASPLGGQRSTRSDERGGDGPQRRAAPSQASPPGGQRSTRSDERGGDGPQRRAAPSQASPLGGQRSTRSDERGGVISVWWPMVTLVWVCIQGAFGALTVTMKLFPLIVTLHLLGGLILLALLQAQAVRYAQAHDAVLRVPLPAGVWLLLAGTFVLLWLQVALGGWVSTNYAVLACNEFPACQGSFWPAMNFREGFTFWRELGAGRDGDNISFQALTAIHYVHRLAAYAVFAALLLLAWRLRRFAALRRYGHWVAGLALWQFLTGLSNVVFDWPLLAAVSHTGGAAALVVVLTGVLFSSRLAAQPSTTSKLGAAPL